MTYVPSQARKRSRWLLLAAASTLAIAGCKDKDAASAAADIDVPGISEAVMAKHFDVEARSIDAASADAALAELKLTEKSDAISWASRSGDNGTYTYSDVVFTSDDGDRTTVGTLELTNVREGANGAELDKLVAEDITIVPADADASGSLDIASITVVEPDMDEVRAFLASDGDVSGLPSAKAFSLVDLDGSFSADDGSGTMDIARVAFAQPTDAAARDGFMMMDDIAIDMSTTENGKPMAVKMNLDDLSASGLADAGIFMGDMEALSNMSSMGNPMALPFKTLNLSGFDAEIDTLKIDMPSAKATYEEKGDRIIGRSSLAPTTIGFTGAPSDSDFAQMYEGLKSFGYEEIVLSAGGDSLVDLKADTVEASDNYFEMKDGFRLEMDYVMGGAKAMMDAQQKALADLGPAPGPDADEFEQMQYSQAAMGASMAGLESMTLDKATIRFDDNSIIDKGFEFAAAQQGTSAKQLKMQTKGLLAMGTMMAQGSGIDPEIASELITALGDFLDKPGSTLVIEADPGTATPLMSLQTLDKAAMGFSASVEK